MATTMKTQATNDSLMRHPPYPCLAGKWQQVLVDIAARAGQGRAMLGEPENQSSLTRAALSTGGRPQRKFLSVTAKKPFSKPSVLTVEI